MRDWRKFELLIATIEKTLLPLGAEIKSPDHLPDLVTGQKREVDASIRFKVGSTPILITVECRKRDSPQDVTWIEQLATKKESIGASTTVAVSSEGFTKAAEELAGRKGIQTRILTETTGSDAAKWVTEVQIVLDLLQWRFAKIQASFDSGPGLDEALTFINGNIDKDDTNAIVGFKRKDGVPVYLWPLASALLDERNYPVMAGIVVKGNVSFAEDVYAPTSTGGLRIQRVEFDIEIVSTTQPVPLINAFNYAGKTGSHVDAATLTFEGPDDQAWNVFVSKSPDP